MQKKNRGFILNIVPIKDFRKYWERVASIQMSRVESSESSCVR